jgi:phage terminase large subunit GpA-like protein
VIEGRRNEVLDCANYARALAAMRGWDRWNERHFARLEQLIVENAAEQAPAIEKTGPTSVQLDLVEMQRELTGGRTWIGRRPGWLGKTRD